MSFILALGNLTLKVSETRVKDFMRKPLRANRGANMALKTLN